MPAGRDFECLQGKKAVIASLVCKITLIIIELCKAVWEDSLIEPYYYCSLLYWLLMFLTVIFFCYFVFVYMKLVLEMLCSLMLCSKSYLETILFKQYKKSIVNKSRYRLLNIPRLYSNNIHLPQFRNSSWTEIFKHFST